jgi:hypothetical protein
VTRLGTNVKMVQLPTYASLSVGEESEREGGREGERERERKGGRERERETRSHSTHMHESRWTTTRDNKYYYYDDEYYYY